MPPSKRLGRSLPPELERIILQCLAKSREDRPHTAALLRYALRATGLQQSWTSECASAWWVERGRDLLEQRSHRSVKSRAPLVTRQLQLSANAE